MDVTRLRKAHDDFLAVAAAGGFGPPPAGSGTPTGYSLMLRSAR